MMDFSSVLSGLGSGGGSFIKDVFDISPIGMAYNEFKEGQKRDEARQVRADDIDRENTWLERNSISGRIAEGTSHGLSKLASLGVNPSSVGPTAVGQSETPTIDYSQSFKPKDKLADRIAEAQIRGLELDNLKKEQDLMPKPVSNPRPRGVAEGQPSSGKVILNLPELEEQQAGRIAGTGGTYQWSESHDGVYRPIPSSIAKERMEDNVAMESMWIYDNMLGSNTPTPPSSMLKNGQRWIYDHSSQGWRKQNVGSSMLEKARAGVKNFKTWGKTGKKVKPKGSNLYYDEYQWIDHPKK